MTLRGEGCSPALAVGNMLRVSTTPHPWNDVAIRSLELALEELRAGRMRVTSFSMSDDDDKLAFAVVLEDEDQTPAEEQARPRPEWEAETPKLRKTMVTSADRCPLCGKRDIRDAGGQDVCCLGCGFNWRPGAEIELEG